MGKAAFDTNFIPTMLMGVSSVDGVTPVPVHIDPVTGRVMGINNIVSSSSSVNKTRAAFDGNYVPTSLGVTNDGAQTPTTLLIDSRNNNLYADVINA